MGQPGIGSLLGPRFGPKWPFWIKLNYYLVLDCEIAFSNATPRCWQAITLSAVICQPVKTEHENMWQRLKLIDITRMPIRPTSNWLLDLCNFGTQPAHRSKQTEGGHHKRTGFLGLFFHIWKLSSSVPSVGNFDLICPPTVSIGLRSQNRVLGMGSRPTHPLWETSSFLWWPP